MTLVARCARVPYLMAGERHMHTIYPSSSRRTNNRAHG